MFATCGIKALLIFDDEVLLLSKPAWFKKTGFKWNDLPGGRVDCGEPCPIMALQRELFEEIGVTDASIFEPIHMASVVNNERAHVVATIYFCKAKTKAITLSQEHTDYCWRKLTESFEDVPIWIRQAIEKLKVMA